MDGWETMAYFRTAVHSTERSFPTGAVVGPQWHARPPAPWRRARRVLLIAVVIALVPAAVSYVRAITGRYNVSVGIESVEWLREHGANRLVSQVEDWYYTITAPAKGGPALRALPQVGLPVQPAKHATVPRLRPRAAYRPHRIPAVINPRLPGEGAWHATFADAAGPPPVLVATFRSEADYPRLVAGVAWLDSHRTRLAYVPGTQEPPVTIPNRGSSEVPPSMRGRLVATFNGGFPIHASGEGLAFRGHTYAPMVDGIGTLVQYTDGRLDVVSWHGGPTVGANVSFAKQNLPLIIDHGRKNPNLSDGPQWGATVGNAIRVWRSAIGIDRRGNLLYAAANIQTVGTLADILLRAGAVRAFELDINQDWTSFITYRHRDAGEPSNLLPNMIRPPTRYLTPDDRDFFAIYLR